MDEFTRTWRSAEWVDHFPLHIHSALDYFKLSDYYDKKCNNELLAMQGKDSSFLRTLVGIEYEVARRDREMNDNWLVIRKQYRVSPEETRLLNLYYIVSVDPPPNHANAPPRGTIIPLPDVQSVLRTNLATAAYHLNEAFSELSKMAKFNLGSEYTWDLATPAEQQKPQQQQQQRRGEFQGMAQDCLQKLKAGQL